VGRMVFFWLSLFSRLRRFVFLSLGTSSCGVCHFCASYLPKTRKRARRRRKKWKRRKKRRSFIQRLRTAPTRPTCSCDLETPRQLQQRLSMQKKTDIPLPRLSLRLVVLLPLSPTWQASTPKIRADKYALPSPVQQQALADVVVPPHQSYFFLLTI
jgi:hypothetical protein